MTVTSAAVVKVEYSTLQTISAQIGERRDLHVALRHRLQDQLDVLRAGKWVGENADAHFKQAEEILCGLDRLIAALSQSCAAINQICALFEMAEEEAGGIFLGGGTGGDAAGVGGGAAGQSGGVFGIPGEIWDRIGSGVSVGGGILELLKQSGVELGRLGKIGDIGGGILGGVMTFFAHFDEEPDHLRGLRLAGSDAAASLALGLATEGVSTIVEAASAADQLAAWGIHDGGYHVVDAANIDAGLRQDIKQTLDNYADTVHDMNVGEVKYRVVAVLSDIQSLDLSHIVGDTGNAIGALGKFAIAYNNRTDRNIDLVTAVVAGGVSHAVNSIPGIPDDMKQSVNSIAREAVEFANKTDIHDLPLIAAGRVIDWLF